MNTDTVIAYIEACLARPTHLIAPELEIAADIIMSYMCAPDTPDKPAMRLFYRFIKKQIAHFSCHSTPST